MPEITVTETQHETLEAVRSDLAAAYIDTYGHIRTTDAVQYLLDTYTPPEQRSSDASHERIATAEFPLLQRVAADVEEVPGSGIDTETMRGELLSTLGVEEFAARLAELDAAADAEDIDADSDGRESTADASTDGTSPAATGDSGESGNGSDGSGDGTDSDGEDSADTDSEDGTDSDGEDSADTDGEDGTDSDGDTGSEPPVSGGSSDSILSAANQLLDDHDDKWRKGSGDEPYEVDLPDGTTEQVRTKDDIRQILFKHY